MMADEVDMVEAGDVVMADGDFFDHEPTKAARSEARKFHKLKQKVKEPLTLPTSLVQTNPQEIPGCIGNTNVWIPKQSY